MFSENYRHHHRADVFLGNLAKDVIIFLLDSLAFGEFCEQIFEVFEYSNVGIMLIAGFLKGFGEVIFVVVSVVFDNFGCKTIILLKDCYMCTLRLQ